MLSKNQINMKLNLEKFSIELSSENGDESIELILTASDNVEVLVNHGTQTTIKKSEIIGEIAKRLEEMEVTTGEKVKELLKERNFFLNLTKLTTLLKLAMLLKMNLEDKALDNRLKETIGEEPPRWKELTEEGPEDFFNERST